MKNVTNGNSNKKYILTQEYIFINNKKLFRIKSIKNFGKIKKGTLGGFIEKEENLSQIGNAWVSGNAKIYDNAEISGNAEIYGNIKIGGRGKIFTKIRLFGSSEMEGDFYIM